MARRPDVLVIGGGGMRGLHGLGAVAQLKKEGQLADVRHIVATSSGAILGYMFATDQLVRGLGLCLRQRPTRDIRLDKLASTFGLDSGRTLDEFLKKLSAPVGEWTFEDMRRETGIDLHVAAVNLSQRKMQYFCAAETPGALVITAIRHSCTVPGLFGVKRASPADDVIVDGGLLDNFPMARGRVVSPSGRVLGIAYKDIPAAEAQQITDLRLFLIAILETVTSPAALFPLPPGERVLFLESESISLDFAATPKQRLGWFQAGAEQARSFLKKNE